MKNVENEGFFNEKKTSFDRPRLNAIVILATAAFQIIHHTLTNLITIQRNFKKQTS
jgi:hypothetical protein